MKLFNDVTILRLPLLKFKGEYEFRIENCDDKRNEQADLGTTHIRRGQICKRIKEKSNLIKEAAKSKCVMIDSSFKSAISEDDNEYSNCNIDFSEKNLNSSSKINFENNYNYGDQHSNTASKYNGSSENSHAYSDSKNFKYNTGRWSEDEHRKFIEAILKYGNEWRSVQSHIKTRSSTQSRSHSQKFFLKIRNINKLNHLILNKVSISSLNFLAKSMNESEKEDLILLLISYEFSDSLLPKSISDKNEDSPALNKKRLKGSGKIRSNRAGCPIFKATKYNHADSEKSAFCQDTKVFLDVSKLIPNKVDALDDFSKTFLNVFSSMKSKLSFDSQATAIPDNDDLIYNTHYISSELSTDRSSQKFDSCDLMVNVELHNNFHNYQHYSSKLFYD